jgi:DNA-binding NarL/FixJ family response regulator
MKRASAKQKEAEGERPVLLSNMLLARLDELGKKTGKGSAAAVIEEAVEIYARLRNEREIEEFAKLTPRLQEVLRLFADGWSMKAIAVQLNISARTVEFHRAQLTRKLGIRPIGLLARYAVRVGAVPP